MKQDHGGWHEELEDEYDPGTLSFFHYLPLSTAFTKPWNVNIGLEAVEVEGERKSVLGHRMVTGMRFQE